MERVLLKVDDLGKRERTKSRRGNCGGPGRSKKKTVRKLTGINRFQKTTYSTSLSYTFFVGVCLLETHTDNSLLCPGDNASVSHWVVGRCARCLDTRDPEKLTRKLTLGPWSLWILSGNLNTQKYLSQRIRATCLA